MSDWKNVFLIRHYTIDIVFNAQNGYFQDLLIEATFVRIKSRC